MAMNLEQAQTTVSLEITAFANYMLNAYFTWNGMPWDCDPQSQINIIGTNVLAILNGGNLPPGFQWRDYNNNMNTVTGADMVQMGVAMAAFIELVYAASWTHKANIMAMTNPTTVLAYDYSSTLWPDPNTQQTLP